MTEWVRLKRFSDWGAEYYALPGRGLTPSGSAGTKLGLKLTGKWLRVRWPSGGVSVEMVTAQTQHRSVFDHGRSYEIAFPLDGIAWDARGIEQWSPLDVVDIDRESLEQTSTPDTAGGMGNMKPCGGLVSDPASIAEREKRFAAGEHICIRCGRTPVDTFGGYCIECDTQVAELEAFKEIRTIFKAEDLEPEELVPAIKKRLCRIENWGGDRPLPEDEEIHAMHPLETNRFDLHAEAMRLVGSRHSKYGLVELVNWLLHRIEKASGK